jgi:hypothetical protein
LKGRRELSEGYGQGVGTMNKEKREKRETGAGATRRCMK